MTLEERFEKVDAEHLKFDRIDSPRVSRPDLHAMLLLDELFPQKRRAMIASAEHDQIWFDVSPEQANTLTDDQIVELSRCGIFWDAGFDCLTRFV